MLFLFLILGFLRITNYRSDRITIWNLMFFFGAILCFYLYLILNEDLKTKYYKPGQFNFIQNEILVFFSPSKRFKKQNILGGYSIFLVSRGLLIASVFLIIKYIFEIFL